MFADARVEIVQCGAVKSSYKVGSARLVSAIDNLPFLLLEVPGLKMQGTAPKFGDGEFEGINDSTIVGYLVEPNRLFDNKGVRDVSSPEIPDGMQSLKEGAYVFRGEPLSRTDTPFAKDNHMRTTFEVPFGVGLTGSPVFDSNGNIVGIVNFGRNIGRNLSIAVAISADSLSKFGSQATENDIQ